MLWKSHDLCACLLARDCFLQGMLLIESDMNFKVDSADVPMTALRQSRRISRREGRGAERAGSTNQWTVLQTDLDSTGIGGA
jgi:hypothetical protein